MFYLRRKKNFRLVYNLEILDKSIKLVTIIEARSKYEARQIFVSHASSSFKLLETSIKIDR